MEAVRQNLRAFVGQTAFEELAQSWLRLQGRNGQLPFVPEVVGSHWSRQVQVDVAAINWQTQDLLLGECKWTGEAVDRSIVRELIEHKAPKVLKDLGMEIGRWRLHFTVFSRYGYTEAAVAAASAASATSVDLSQLDDDLAGTPAPAGTR